MHSVGVWEEKSMNRKDILLGVGLGAIAAFMSDPNSGRRRRALVRDQIVRAGRRTRDAADATARDIANRTRGIVAASVGRIRGDAADDRRLLERVRAKLGRVCSHPRGIDVQVENGVVTLRGAILSREVDDLLREVESVRGVRAVVNELERHQTTQGVPSLQGEGRVAGPTLDILQSNWAPATQALVAAGVAATGLFAADAWRRRRLSHQP
jgi:hypothetical protein